MRCQCGHEFEADWGEPADEDKKPKSEISNPKAEIPNANPKPN